MEKIVEFVLECQKNNLTVIPAYCPADLAPKEWYNWNEDSAEKVFLDPKIKDIGVFCGKESGNLQVIEVDCETVDEKTQFAKFLYLVHQEAPIIYNQLVILSTPYSKQIYFRNESPKEGWGYGLAWDDHAIIAATISTAGFVVFPFAEFEFLKGNFSVIPHFSDLIKTMLIDKIKQVFEKFDPSGDSPVPENDKPESTPLLPIEGFPEKIRWIIEQFSKVYRTPRDFWAASVLSAIGLAIGDKMMLKDKYENYPSFWTVLVGDVSSGKSLPIDICFKWFRKHDGKMIKDYKAAMAEYRNLTNMSVEERHKEGFHEKPVEPRCFQYILNDYTPEAMFQAHEVNDRGLMVICDELKGWLDNFDRYNKSGEQSMMLSAWSHLPITVNRKSSGVMNIEKPILNVVGGIQPDLLPSLASEQRVENGFLSRFMVVYPDNAKKAEYSDEELDDQVIVQWEEILTRLADSKEQMILQLSPGAKDLYRIWYNINVKRTNEEKSGYLKGIYSKLDIISQCLAIVIHGMNAACGKTVSNDISMEEMKAALDIAEYFRATGIKVYRRIFEHFSSEPDLKNIAGYLHQQGVTKSEIARILKTSRSQIDRYLQKSKDLAA